MAIFAQNVGVISQTVYTSSGDTAVTMLSLCNHDAGLVTVDVHLVPQGGGASTSNLILSSLEIVADDSYVINEKIFLETGDFIVVAVIIGDINKVSAVTSYVAL